MSRERQKIVSKPTSFQTGRILMRQTCACGGAVGPTGECAECRRKRLLEGTVQTKMRINQPGDRFEREADRMAEQVMQAPVPQLQRQVENEEEEEEELLMPKQVVQNSAAAKGGEAPAVVHDVLRSPGRPLDRETQNFMGSHFGFNFDRVRVHTDPSAAQSAAAVNARAYTVGNNVVFGSGQYAPDTYVGRRLLAHELVHVMQQTGREAAVQRDFARQPRGGGAAVQELTDQEVADAVTFNQNRLSDRYMIGQIRDVLGISQEPMVADEAFARAVGRFQALWSLGQDGMLGHLTTFRLFREFVAEGLRRDAVLLLIESYGLRVDRALFDIRFSSAAAFCNRVFAEVGGGRHCGVGNIIMTVCSNDLRTGSLRDYNLMIRVINHELVHVPQCARGTGNADVDEFEAFHSEVCGRGAAGRMPHLTAAQRVASANDALTHFAGIPAAFRTARRIRMRTQLQTIVAAGGVGRCP